MREENGIDGGVKRLDGGSAARGGLGPLVAAVQGAYYLLSGAWPILHAPSFLLVTGPKEDVWLVKTVGILIAVIGVVLLVAAWRRAVGLEISLLAVASAVALAVVDVWYYATGVINYVYLVDAGLEALIVAAWALAWQQGRRAVLHRTPVT